jgi:hypothetical protein
MRSKEAAKNRKNEFPAGSFAASIFIHLFIVIAAIVLIKFNVEKSEPPKYLSLVMSEIAEGKVNKEEEKAPKDEKLPDQEKKEEVKKEEVKPEEPPKAETVSHQYMNFTDHNADTTSLNQVYQEGTLNVRIKYPRGWTYIDQNVKNKLDGVTFWSADNRYNPPPYVHLEVKEKYLFNPRRYKYELRLRDAVAHYNDPKEMSGQVSQEFYIRTENDEDFSIKLIMEGENNFKQFQPEFFSMIKTFRFGKSLF